MHQRPLQKNIAILGSTGSIGTQALEVIRQHFSYFSVQVLTANTNAQLLIRQALEFKPEAVVIADEKKYKEVKDALFKTGTKVYSGDDSLSELMESDHIDLVLTAMVGFAGLKPTLAAIRNKKNIALANKETLVVAGELITKSAKENGIKIIPVDSEHSAIFQCLAGEDNNPIEKIYLTASGGPFRGKKKGELKNITPAQALRHPNWNMGAKITIDSATLMNKGLEVIEARWLFGLSPEHIKVVIHPQSIIHSMVQFEDGSIKAQMGPPDMRLPILYAFSCPTRLKSVFPRFDFSSYQSFTFERPDIATFPNLKLAYIAAEKGGNLPCILNAANEIAVEAFLHGKISFLKIPGVIEKCMYKIQFVNHPSFDDYIKSDKETRIFAEKLIH